MYQKGRWVVAAQALLVCCLHTSCSTASAVKGAKWKSDPSSGSFAYPRRQISNAWEEVTSVLKQAVKNATFPGVFPNLFTHARVPRRGAGVNCWGRGSFLRIFIAHASFYRVCCCSGRPEWLCLYTTTGLLHVWRSRPSDS